MKQLTVFACIFVLLFSLVYRPAHASADESGQTQLDVILANTAQYCERLKSAAFHFTCEEAVSESSETRTFYKKYGEPGYGLQRTGQKNKYVNQYQLLKEEDKITEQRTPLMYNGKKITGTASHMKTRITSFKSSLTPYYLFGREYREKYSYRIIGKEKVLKRSAYICRVDLKKAGGESVLFAVVWIDLDDYSIVKFRAFPESIEGYRNLDKAGEHRVDDVRIEDDHYYGYKESGLRFPTRTEISLVYTHDYPGRNGEELDISAGARVLKKVVTTFSYNKYQFFSVTVSSPEYLSFH